MIFMILWVVSVIYFRFSYLIHWWKSIFVFFVDIGIDFFFWGGDACTFLCIIAVPLLLHVHFIIFDLASVFHVIV